MDRESSYHSAEARGIALWVIVGAGLLYGVFNTASQVVNLFGG